ncbi:MAG: hypothetical protein ABIC91_09145 [Nanoarchaeota archaeon]|nr:hypothetical protein [Nanoarchaeota archaeon]MBU1029999.1 hypothetical protein [Nanoarchaeota archaeon]MBU1850185.1 hypothetical protein [Nanoarchaeota archaeon]
MNKYLLGQVLEHKICKARKRFNDFNSQTIPYTNLEECLTIANDIAVNSLEQGTWLNKLILHGTSNPSCVHYSKYTYAAFLNLTEANQEFRDDVVFVIGYTILEFENKKKKGYHAFLMYNKDSKYKVLETIPDNRDAIRKEYYPMAAFQTGKKLASKKMAAAVFFTDILRK